jgi:hypothetical protein
VSEPGWFKPLHGKPRIHEICSFDVEGRGGEGGFVCGAISSASGSEFYLDHQAMFESLLDHGARGEWLFAHNLEYDLPIVAGRRLLEGDLLFKNQGMLWATYAVGKRKARFYDSTNLFPRMSVSRLGALVGLPKLSPGQTAVGALATSTAWDDLSPDAQRELGEYCARDAAIVHGAVELLQETLALLGGELRPTIAGCALDLYRRTFHKWPWRSLGEATNGLARGAFYGGRCEAFMLGKVEGVSLYDTNSLYPFVQDHARFPLPGRLRLDVAPQGLGALKGSQGVAQARLTAPEAFLPLLPHRFTHRLFFPVGSMEGVWTLEELREAQDRGVEILDLKWALHSPATFNPFHEFVSELWKRRQGYLAADDGRAGILKLLLNSLYGRFGLNPDDGLWRMLPLQVDPGDGRYRGFVTSEVHGEPVMMGHVPSAGQPAYVNVLIAAQVAAEARLHLFRAMEGQHEDLAYCDTDSILTRGQLPEDDGLGGWRLQMRSGRADLVGPKEYLLHNAVMGEKAVVKGVPEGQAALYLRTGAARYRRAKGIRESIAKGNDPSTWVEVLKERGHAIPKRCPTQLGDDAWGSFCLTVPWDVSQLPLATTPEPARGKVATHALDRLRREGSVAYIQTLS